jgi:hypothetical protein
LQCTGPGAAATFIRPALYAFFYLILRWAPCSSPPRPRTRSRNFSTAGAPVVPAAALVHERLAAAASTHALQLPHDALQPQSSTTGPCWPPRSRLGARRSAPSRARARSPVPRDDDRPCRPCRRPGASSCPRPRWTWPSWCGSCGGSSFLCLRRAATDARVREEEAATAAGRGRERVRECRPRRCRRGRVLPGVPRASRRGGGRTEGFFEWCRGRACAGDGWRVDCRRGPAGRDMMRRGVTRL